MEHTFIYQVVKGIVTSDTRVNSILKSKEVSDSVSGYSIVYTVNPYVKLKEIMHDRVEVNITKGNLRFTEYIFVGRYSKDGLSMEDKLLLNYISMLTEQGNKMNGTRAISELQLWVQILESAIKVVEDYTDDIVTSKLVTPHYTNVLRVYFKGEYKRERLTDDYQVGVMVGDKKVLIDIYKEITSYYIGVKTVVDDTSIKIASEVRVHPYSHSDIEKELLNSVGIVKGIIGITDDNK